MIGKIVAVLLGFLLFSCRDMNPNGATKHERRTKVRRLADVGRRIQVSQDSPDKGFALAGDVRVSIRRDNAKGYITWAAFNTDLVETVNGKEIINYALDYIDAHSDEFGITSQDLDKTDPAIVKPTDKLLVLKMKRFASSLPVRDSFVEFTYFKVETDRFKLREIHNRSFGPITIANEGSVFPTVEELVEQSGFEKIEVIGKRNIIFPKSEVKETIFLRATEFKVQDTDSKLSYTITMEAGTLNIVEAYRNYYFERFNFKGAGFDRSYVVNNDKKDFVLPYTETGTAGSLTDGDGSADLAAAPANSNVRLSSPRAKVVIGEPTLQTFPVGRLDDDTQVLSIAAVTNGNEIKLDPNDLNNQAALNAYIATHRIHRFAKKHLKVSDTVMLTDQIRVVTNTMMPVENANGNIVYEGCNAAYFPDFFLTVFTSAFENCANTALVTDIVAHEWCHGLDDKTSTPGIQDAAFSEGLSDVCSAFLLGSNVLGLGFFQNQAVGIRNLKNTRVYPGDINLKDQNGQVITNGNGVPIREPHNEGLIIGGAFWDMREGLIAKHGPEKGTYLAENLFFKHLLTTDAYLNSYQAVIRLDDDDGNPATPSPNHCIINKAFSQHGLATLEQNCVDTDAAIKDSQGKEVKPNLDLYFGLEPGEQAGQFTYTVSGKEVAKVDLCLGTDTECVKSQKVDAKFAWTGKKDGRDFFKNSTSLNIADYSYITLIATGYYGEKSYRTLKIVPK